MKFYAGIGPRSTPVDVQHVMTDIARQLVPTGWCLRSGYAKGADRAFGKGAVNQQIFLPWDGYNGGFANGIDKAVVPFSDKMIEIARDSYERDPRHQTERLPDWYQLNNTTVHLLCRNVPIILGENLDDPVSCVITWLPAPDYQGGTRHALRIASTYGVPMFDLNIREDQLALIRFIFNAENRAEQHQTVRAA